MPRRIRTVWISREDGWNEVRVMGGPHEGYLMVRYPHCVPFCVMEKETRTLPPEGAERRPIR